MPPLGGSQATKFGETLSLQQYTRQLQQMEETFTRDTTKYARPALAHGDAEEAVREKDWTTFEAHRFFIATNQRDVKSRLQR